MKDCRFEHWCEPVFNLVEQSLGDTCPHCGFFVPDTKSNRACGDTRNDNKLLALYSSGNKIEAVVLLTDEIDPQEWAKNQHVESGWEFRLLFVRK